MGEVTIEFESAIKLTNLSEQEVKKTDANTNSALYQQLLNHFVDGKDRRWWWEAFKTSFHFVDYDYPPKHLSELIPNLNDDVWLMIEDGQEPYYPIYNIKPSIISDLLSNCFAFEYYIIDKSIQWLLCETHHKDLIGVGDMLKKFNRERIIQ